MRTIQLRLHPTTLGVALLFLPLGGWPNACSPFLPPLASSVPADGAGSVLRTSWIDLQFAEPIPMHAPHLALHCDSETGEHATLDARLGLSRLVLNPVGELPGGDTCHLSWPESAGTRTLTFSTAPAGAPLVVFDDRTDHSSTSP